MNIKEGDFIIPSKKFFEDYPALKYGVRLVVRVGIGHVTVDKPFLNVNNIHIGNIHWKKIEKTKLIELLYGI